MSTGAPILIVGASAAGVSAARGLRESGFEGGVVLIDADPNLPYERPPLSKQLIEAPAAVCEDFPLLTAPQADALGLELRLGERVKSLSAETLAVTFEHGETIGGSAILLATGGRARRLPVPGIDLAGVHVIRTFADAQGLRDDLASARTVAVIGGGLIGAEAAMSVLRAGKPVVWIDAAQAPLSHIFPDVIAIHLVGSHLAAGLELRAGARLRRLLGRGGRVVAVEMEDGERIAADVVILGVGMSPDDDLARAAGLEVSCGVHVGQDHRTSAPGVFAAGDVAALATPGPGRRRHEHWRSAQAQGANAARAIMGLPLEAPAVPWFWSDQGAHHVEMAGRRTGDSLVRRGGKGPIVWEMDGDCLAGVASVDEPNAVRVGLRLIQSGKTLDREALTDPRVDPRILLRA